MYLFVTINQHQRTVYANVWNINLKSQEANEYFISKEFGWQKCLGVPMIRLNDVSIYSKICIVPSTPIKALL